LPNRELIRTRVPAMLETAAGKPFNLNDRSGPRMGKIDAN
jgi:hypothetical protein